MLCLLRNQTVSDLPETARKRAFFFLFLSLFSFFWAGAAKAQEEFIQPPSKLLTSFPFTLFTGGVILLKATLTNFPDTLNFILDTGSGGISLDSATCERLKLVGKKSHKPIRGIA